MRLNFAVQWGCVSVCDCRRRFFPFEAQYMSFYKPQLLKILSDDADIIRRNHPTITESQSTQSRTLRNWTAARGISDLSSPSGDDGAVAIAKALRVNTTLSPPLPDPSFHSLFFRQMWRQGSEGEFFATTKLKVPPSQHL